MSFIEYRTPGIYHASTTVLAPLDRILDRFLGDLHITALEVLLNFNLAPLSCRRDIAMLGLIHRTVLGLGPSQFRRWFKRDYHPPRMTGRFSQNTIRRLEERQDLTILDVGRRSVFGLIRVYNMLPNSVVQASSVKEFQRLLTMMMKILISQEYRRWDVLLSPRIPINKHPLHCLRLDNLIVM